MFIKGQEHKHEKFTIKLKYKYKVLPSENFIIGHCIDGFWTLKVGLGITKSTKK